MNAPVLPPHLRAEPRLDRWIGLEAGGRVVLRVGKAELGQGVLTALAQIAATELDVRVERISVVPAGTGRAPDQGYTYGSQSIEVGGAAIRLAAAHARALLLGAAATRFGVPVRGLTVDDGMIGAPDGRRISYWRIAADAPGLFESEIPADTVVRPLDAATGVSVPRTDLPAKFTGGASFVQDIRLPGMAFGRMVRPPHYGARLESADTAGVAAMPGVLTVFRDGSVLGVVAAREEQAVAARARLAASARWKGGTRLPDIDQLAAALLESPSMDAVIADRGGNDSRTADHSTHEGWYSRPYLSHASLGPSCALAWMTADRLTVWSHTQGVYPLRAALAEALGLPPSTIEVLHTQGAGCYGHNGADDAAFDAALLARALPGTPVQVQWHREDEFAWEPYGPAMLMRAAATLTADGRIAAWDYELWSNTHHVRPGEDNGVNLLAAWYLATPSAPSPPGFTPNPPGDGDRNAIPTYEIPRLRVTNHLLLDTPLRNSSLRLLGAHGNIFATESFMDELALAADADPVQFRLAHLNDPRARAVITTAAEHACWATGAHPLENHGRGIAFARYKMTSTYAAAVAEVEVDPDTGLIRVRSVTIAADVGRVINPDGVANQLEGGVVQGISWTLKEQVRFDRQRITSLDWSGYPILTFPEVPDIDIVLLDHPDQPSLGAGEGSTGPTSAAVANAVAHATGVRFRDLPFTPARVRPLLRR